MAEPRHHLLADERRLAGAELRLSHGRQDRVLLLGDEICLDLEGAVEIILDGALAPPGDEDHLLDPGGERLVDRVLDQRLVDDRQQLLGHRLGRGQEARAEARHREHRLAYLRHHSTPLSPSHPGTLSAPNNASIGCRCRTMAHFEPDTSTSAVSGRLL